MHDAQLHWVEDHTDTSTMLGKALEIIRLLSLRPQGVGTREAARLTGIDKSAVSRILGRLEEHDWIQRNLENDKYRPGQALYAVAASLQNNDDVWNAGRDQLVRLNKRFNETIYLTSRVGDFIVFRDKIESRQAIRYVVDPGVPFSLASGGASATAVLSALSPAEQARILKGGLKRYTPNSVVDPVAFQEILDEDRRRGFSYSRGRWAENSGGVGSPYFNAEGTCLGSVTLACPLFRLEKLDVAELGAAVRDAARAISQRSGYPGFV